MFAEEDTIMNVLKNIDWQRFHNLCISLGTELNDSQWRFLKSIFLEKAIAEYSNKILVYVGNEKNGCDFIIPSLNNASVEMKYSTESIYKEKSFALREKTKPITLLNSKGTNKHLNLPDNYAEYLLLVDTYSAAIISKEKLKNYVSSNGDSLTAVIPTSELSIVFNPSNIKMSEKKSLNIKEQFIKTIDTIISDA
jgi:hypothetical protein